MSEAKYTPPFTVKDVHICPFKEKKVYRPDGTFYYEPIEPTHKTTGIPLMDDYIKWLSAGGIGYDRMTFYRHHYLNIYRDRRWFDGTPLPNVPSDRDFSGMIMILFGMEVTEFQTAYCLRTAKLLLVNTNLSVNDVAKRASLICSSNMARVFRKKGLPPPQEYRRRRRKELGITNPTMYKL